LHAAIYIAAMSASAHAVQPFQPGGRVGELLRSWRLRRNLSQQALASHSAVSPRYLSFIETGRARPRRVMVMHLAERLEVPLRDRNDLLFAAGYAPVCTGSVRSHRPRWNPWGAETRSGEQRRGIVPR
jgi:transcriptional regulator with XRE-family HTH domain